MDANIRRIAEECSCDNIPVHDLSLIYLRPYIESFIDSSWLQEKLNEYEHWAVGNSDPVLQRNLLHRPLGMNILVAMIWAARSWEREHSIDSSFLPPAGAKRLINITCSMAVLEFHAGAYLDSEARTYVKQRLQAANNFFGMAHEINTFAHFIRKGATVEPKFLKSASPQEIMVNWQMLSIPVQCKSKQPGAGRLISQDDFITLAGSIASDARKARHRLLVRIGSSGPLTHQDITLIRRRVSGGAGRGIAPDLITQHSRVFSLKVQPLSGRFTLDSVRNYLESFHFHAGMVIGEPMPNSTEYTVYAVVGVDANPDERVRASRSLRKSIKEGARQLEGGSPGIVAVHYADSVNDFETLRAGIAPMISEMAKIMHPLSHLATIMLSSEPDFQIPGLQRGGSVRSYVKESCGFSELLGQPV